MSCTNDLLEGLGGWLNTVAQRFANGYLQKEDFVQEGSLAILTAEAQEEALAKTVALRAMTKLRKRHDLVRTSTGSGKVCVGRSQCDMGHLTVVYEDSGVFWDNVEAALQPADYEALRRWLDSDDSLDQIGRTSGVSGRTLRGRVERACRTLRERAGVEPDQPTERRQPKRGMCAST